MKAVHRLTLVWLAGGVALPLVSVAGEPATALPLIQVTGDRWQSPASEVLVPEPVARLAGDASVSLSRMGGRGLDPIIRGQGRDRVDVLLDGIRVEGACPNRMDPATSRLSSALTPLLDVRTTNQTLRWGPITGGQIMATTAAPRFADGVFTGHLTAGGSDNGSGSIINGSAALGNDRSWVRLAGGHDKADDYDDGDGNQIRSAFTNREGRLDAGWTADNGFYLQGLLRRQQERDVKYAGSGMDAPKTDTDIARLTLGSPVGSGDWKLVAWQADVDHRMDSVSLRTSGMAMVTDSQTRTQGLRLTLDQTASAQTGWATGLDLERNNWEAERFGGDDLAMLTSVIWPDVDRDRVGLFAEASHRLTRHWQLGGGVRYDRVEMSPDSADKTFGMGMMSNSAATIYQQVYGTTELEQTDHNISAFLDSRWQFKPGHALEVTASRSVRSPGVTERYLASWSMMPAKRWVGNPALDTEKHHKLELALEGREGALSWRPAIWVDQVEDFILRTRNADQLSVYRNVDARLLGAEAEVSWHHGPWQLASTLATVRGTNRDSNSALPQIPPLQFSQTLDWHSQGHQLGIEWQLARRQDRVDLGSGQDADTSPGYGVINLTGLHPLMEGLSLTWAVDNLFDKTWAPHVSRANTDPFNPEAIRVHEPGRTLRAALTARW